MIVLNHDATFLTSASCFCCMLKDFSWNRASAILSRISSWIQQTKIYIIHQEKTQIYIIHKEAQALIASWAVWQSIAQFFPDMQHRLTYRYMVKIGNVSRKTILKSKREREIKVHLFFAFPLDNASATSWDRTSF